MRHDLYWKNQEGPLICKSPFRHWVPKPYPLKKGRFATQPSKITPSDLDISAIIKCPDENDLFNGDLIDSVGSMFPTSWMEAIAGCDIFVSAHGCVARPAVKTIREAIEKFSIEKAMKSEWFSLLNDFVDLCIEHANRKKPVQQPHFRGVVDVVAAFLGEQVFCESIYDNPDELKKIIHLISELFIEVAKIVNRKIPDWYNHHVSCWKISAPDKLLDYQIDASSLLNPRLYYDFFGNIDRSILKEFPYSVVHTHSICLSHIQHFLDSDTKTCIEINLDREAVPWNPELIVSACCLIQAKGKPILLDGMLTDDELNGLINLIDSRGLAINYWTS